MTSASARRHRPRLRGPVHRRHAPRPGPARSPSRRGRVVAVGSDDEVLALRGPRTEVVDLARRPARCPASRTRTSTRSRPASTCSAATSTTAGPRTRPCAVVAEYAAANPDLPWVIGGGWSMEHFPAGTPTRGDARRAPSRTARRSCRTATATARGSTPGPSSSPGITARDPRPGRRPDRAGARRDAAGHPPRGGRCTSSSGCSRRSRRPSSGWAARRAGAPVLARRHRPGRTPRSGEMFGQSDLLPVYRAAAASGDLARVGRRRAVVGPHPQQRPDRRPRRTARGRRDRPVPADVREDHARRRRRELHRGDARAVPRRLRLRHRQLRARLRRPGGPAGVRDPARRARASRCTSTRSATAPSGTPSTPSRRPARRTGRAAAQHHLAHLQVVHPDDVPRFARVGATANIQALWAAHEHQMDELTIPFLGERRASWQYPFGDLLRAGHDPRRRAATGR